MAPLTVTFDTRKGTSWETPMRRSPVVELVWWVGLGVASTLAPVAPAAADFLDLKNGMQLRGDVVRVASLGDDVLNPESSGPVNNELIVVVDDGLTRTFVSFYDIADKRPETGLQEKIQLDQPVAVEGNRLGNIGSILGVSPFDRFGRRTFSMMGLGKRVDVIQGITEITPTWTRIRGLKAGKHYVWDMRVATSSIPRDQLQTIVGSHLDMDDPDVRLGLVRLHMQSERYDVAEVELREAIQAFPDLADFQQQLRELRQLRSQQQLDEIKRRRAAAQHLLVQSLLQKFPDQDVAGEVLLEVSEILDAYATARGEGQSVIERLTELAQIPAAQPHAEWLTVFLQEIRTELNYSSLGRMQDFLQLMSDPELSDNQKLALGISGWLLGGNGTDNFSVAASLWEVRGLVQRYLTSVDPQERTAIIERLRSLEGGAPPYVAAVMATMRPPVRTEGLRDRFEAEVAEPAEPAEPAEATDAAPPVTPAAASEARPPTPWELQQRGQFRIEIPSYHTDESLVYHVQLPPEYDAGRRYPMIVTLHAAGSRPEMQIEWWAGAYNDALELRTGQASRYGYIVVAPEWAESRQRTYGYSAREHAAVLAAVRDALFRFSVDSNRIFLSGHSMGGDAAWDIGLAHPDLWAGVIPICGVAEYGQKDSPKYVSRYWENARWVPFYFVGGALDGRMLDLNSRDWNRYFKRTQGFDVMVVEYRGRGEEHFQDEIQRLFTWMELHERDFYLREFEVGVMRPLDNFFWWVEVDGIPSGSLVWPAQWPPSRGARPARISGTVREKRNVFLTTPTTAATVWLAPDLVDLDSEVAIRVNGRPPIKDVRADVAVLLEDARQRGDRQHPFWAKVDLTTGR